MSLQDSLLSLHSCSLGLADAPTGLPVLASRRDRVFVGTWTQGLGPPGIPGQVGQGWLGEFGKSILWLARPEPSGSTFLSFLFF